MLSATHSSGVPGWARQQVDSLLIQAGCQAGDSPIPAFCRSAACSAASLSSLLLQQQAVRGLSTTLSAHEAADAQQQQQDASNSASEPASSFIVNPAGSAAAPPPVQHAPTAGGVLAGPGAAAMKEYSMRQVSKHADDESCWIVVNGKVRPVAQHQQRLAVLQRCWLFPVAAPVPAWTQHSRPQATTALVGCRTWVCLSLQVPPCRCTQCSNNLALLTTNCTALRTVLQVYDVTSYLDDHPGGADSILQNSGVDCTDEFMAVHSQVRLGTTPWLAQHPCNHLYCVRCAAGSAWGSAGVSRCKTRWQYKQGWQDGQQLGKSWLPPEPQHKLM